ncbi:MAG: tyrosine-type recombinase/integrase, partial [Candidatus Peribacteraceae bacterium]|nr:tyrosine-type recombinase/integrase [Candidatus Peribacteraceae bacterium]
NLKIGQITFDKDKVGTVKLRREKVQHDYFTFISPESTKTLKEYWKGRERNIDRKLVKSDYAFVTKDENQINTQVFMNFFQDLARRAGYEKGTKKRYCDIRSHAFRKFFSSTMQQDGMKKDDVDALLGHVPDGTDQAYFSNDIDILKEKYIKHLPAITLAETIEINTVDAEQFEAQAAELAELRAAQKKSEEREREIDAQLTAIQELLKLGAMHNIKT